MENSKKQPDYFIEQVNRNEDVAKVIGDKNTSYSPIPYNQLQSSLAETKSMETFHTVAIFKIYLKK